MACEIKWTPAAKENYRELVSYIFDHWGSESAEKFTNELQARLNYLEHFPLLGKQHATLSSVRQLIVNKRQVLFTQ